jgi:hypothetical protein
LIVANRGCVRPTEPKSISDLRDYYWLKTELMKFCRKNQLSTSGAKIDLLARIDSFLCTGVKIKPSSIKTSSVRDSLKVITINTRVVNYKNDAVTRKFFMSKLGKKFKFNTYLRQFTNSDNIKSNMTYGDLVHGWIEFEQTGKNHNIPKQFEYNQFIKDYFLYEEEGCLEEAIRSWYFIKTRSGPNTYERFKTFANNISKSKI